MGCTDEHWTKPAFIVMGCWGAGASMILWLAGLQGIPQHLYEAAELDGAGVFAGCVFASPSYPFLWSAGKAYNLSSQIPGPYVEGINAGGQIVGNVANSDANSTKVCYLWTPTVAHGTSGTSVQLALHASGLTDTGQETNGLLTEKREFKLDPEVIREINSRTSAAVPGDTLPHFLPPISA